MSSWRKRIAPRGMASVSAATTSFWRSTRSACAGAAAPGTSLRNEVFISHIMHHKIGDSGVGLAKSQIRGANDRSQGEIMFHQLLTPVGDSLALSFLVAVLPIATVLILLGVLKRPAWQAALAGLVVGLLIAVTVWSMPVGTAFASAANGMVFALWPVMWIVINALLLYNVAVASGRFDAFRAWLIKHLPNDRRVVLIAIGFCFGALLEGIAGFGAPVAITASLLIMCGFPALEAVVFVLLFNTTPVAFGALGTPVTVLGAVTGLPAPALAAMIGRQLPFMALILPFYVIGLYGRWRSIRAVWPVLLVAGGTFGASQFLASNYLDYTLTDVFAALGSLVATLLFLQVWRPAADPEFAIAYPPLETPKANSRPVPAWQEIG